MKIIKLICLMMMLFSLTVFAAKGDISEIPDVISVNDFASVVSENTKIFIYNANNTLLENTASKIIFVTVPTTGQMSIDEYANQVYRNWGIASIGDNSSTFVLMAVEDMEYWVIVGEHLSSAFTRDNVEEILLEHMEPEFASGNFDKAVKNTFIAISDWYTGHYNLSADYNTKEEPEAPVKEKKSNGVLWSVIKVILVVAVIFAVGYVIIKRQLRLYAIEQRKRQRIQSYRKYSRRSPGSGDYEYFEFYDTKE